MTTQYKHEPLSLPKQQIRLLEVNFEDSDILSGTLRHLDLGDDYPPYQALSYTWGAPEPQYQIRLNDNQPFAIRQNLYAFLNVFVRKPAIQSQYIWIDQICIDQTSLDEKNHQVPLIGDIYSKAKNVLIWLGHHNEGEKFRNICKELQEDPELASRPVWALSDEEQAVMERLMEVPYTKRLWVIQEIMLASKKTIVYGEDILDWDLFINSQLAANLSRFSHVPRLMDSTMMWFLMLQFHRVYSQDPESSRTRPISDRNMAILMSTEKVCQDPRDQIFGLQNILPETARIEVDYRKSVEEVFLEAAAQSIIHFTSKRSDAAPDWQIDNLAFSMGLVEKEVLIATSVKRDRIRTCITWLEDDVEPSELDTIEKEAWLDRRALAQRRINFMTEYIHQHGSERPLDRRNDDRQHVVYCAALLWAYRRKDVSD